MLMVVQLNLPYRMLSTYAKIVVPYTNLANEHRQRAYRLFREHHAVTASRLARRNNPITHALRLSPPYAVGGRA